MNNMRTIRVTGKGQIKVKPDMTRLYITLEGINKEYAETLEQSSVDTAELRKIMGKFGFEKADLKTIRFDVDPEYSWYERKNKQVRKLDGYKFIHRLKVEFESDNKRLGKIVYALAHSPVNPEFSISYTVKDPEKSKNKLLGEAVKDAMAKAEVLAEASGVTLKDIQNIDYSWGTIDLEVRPANDRFLALECYSSKRSYDLDIEPDDISVSDTVTVVWEIG